MLRWLKHRCWPAGHAALAASSRFWRALPSGLGLHHIRRELIDDVARRAVVPDHVPRTIGRLCNAHTELMRGLPHDLREMACFRTKTRLVEVIMLYFAVPGVNDLFG